jgi:hypothetical protein
MVRGRGAASGLIAEIEAFLRCRSYGHSWDEFFPDDMEQPWYGWRLSLRCVRCSTERHDNIGFNGQMLGRRYIYPPGYQTPKGDPKPERSVFREELFTHLRERLEKVNAVGADATVTPIKKARKARISA